MRPVLLSLLCGIVMCSAFSEIGAQTPGGATDAPNEGRKVSETVQLTTKIVNQQYCAQATNAQRQETQLRLWLKLALRNVSNRVLIVPRFSNNIYTVLLSKSLEKAKAKRYMSNIHYSFMRLDSVTRHDFPEASPTDEFVILKPNGLHEYEYDQIIDISLTNSSDESTRCWSCNAYIGGSSITPRRIVQLTKAWITGQPLSPITI